MSINIQPVLENDEIMLYPLEEQDFEALYNVAADPKIWEQHPNKDRWKRDVFKIFFEGAMQSHGAFRIAYKATGSTIGSTRFYDYDAAGDSIFIGYTFYAAECWGKGINQTVKKMMLGYIFQFVSKVYFHIGSENIRSQIAIGRLGAVKTGEQTVSYYGELPKNNFVHCISRDEYPAVTDR